jgi:TPR repeat protein
MKLDKTQVCKKLFNDARVAWDKNNLRRAFELFGKCAEFGDSSCQSNLGYFYDVGLHVKKNKKMAFNWYYKAYRTGDGCAAENIAILHREKGDTNKMLWWLKKAVVLRDGDALFQLGKCYEGHWRVRKNLIKAKSYYRRVLRSKYVTQESIERAQERLAAL